MSSSKENNDYPEDIHFRRLSSLLPALKKKGAGKGGKRDKKFV